MKYYVKIYDKRECECEYEVLAHNEEEAIDKAMNEEYGVKLLDISYIDCELEEIECLDNEDFFPDYTGFKHDTPTDGKGLF